MAAAAALVWWFGYPEKKVDVGFIIFYMTEDQKFTFYNHMMDVLEETCSRADEDIETIRREIKWAPTSMLKILSCTCIAWQF